MIKLAYFLKKISIVPCLVSLLLVVSIGISYAQEQTYHTSQRREKGYWKFRTDYATRCTIVWFYTKDHELIYREELPQKYLKPTKGNMRTLDRILARLQEKNLVVSQANVSELTVSRMDISSIPIGLVTEKKPVPAIALKNHSATHLQANVYCSKQLPGISIRIENPKEEKVFISLKQESKLVYYRYVGIFEEFTQLAHHRLDLNLAALKEGQYHLSINSRSKKYSYSVYIYEDNSGKKLKIIPL